MPANELQSMLMTGVGHGQGGDTLRRMLDQPETHRLQIILSTLPDRQAHATAETRTITFRADAEYFYPASTVKLISATCALRQLATWRRESADTEPHVHTPFRIGDAEPTTVARELRKIFLTSDNPAHNLLHDLVGHRALHEITWAAGLKSVRLRHRLSANEPPERARSAARISFQADARQIQIAERTSDLDLPSDNIPGLGIGRAYVDSTGAHHDRPMSFAEKNRVSLHDLHVLTMMAFAPESRESGFGLEPADQGMLATIAALDAPPPEASASNKFLLPGLLRVRPRAEWRVLNKVGRAYGFSLDTGVIEHLPSASRRAISATLYTNDSEELNTDRYDYARDADPFMADLGEAIGREMTRSFCPG
ncbi:MAG: class A beta-lactamase-related serine hydrolase [Phycisphaerales bacterium]|nr:class A beta-lactamase-related serine hydrolase [Phycisphaerales bacterium]